MGLFSLLPASLSVVETWIVRFFVGGPFSDPLPCSSYHRHLDTDTKMRCDVQCYFLRFACNSCADGASTLQLLLGLLTIGPWAILIIYDFLLYCMRAVAHEVPVVGGRAHGQRRPRAPSLNERPSGKRRRWESILGLTGWSSRSGGSSGGHPQAVLEEDKDK